MAQVYQAEAKRLLRTKIADDEDWKRARDIQKDMASHEAARAQALLTLLGGSLNVKDLTPEQLAVLADKLLKGQE